MNWYRVTLAFSESDKMKSLEDSFKRLFEERGSPGAAALFLTRDGDSKTIAYYFSPAAMTFSRKLIEQRKGERCLAPSPTLEGLTFVFRDRTGDLERYHNCYPSLPE